MDACVPDFELDRGDGLHAKRMSYIFHCLKRTAYVPTMSTYSVSTYNTLDI